MNKRVALTAIAVAVISSATGCGTAQSGISASPVAQVVTPATSHSAAPPAATVPATAPAPPYRASCKLVPSNPSWGPAWAGTDMPQVTLVNDTNTVITVAYIGVDYTTANGVINGSDSPVSPTVNDIPPGSTADIAPLVAGYASPPGATGCAFDAAGSDMKVMGG